MTSSSDMQLATFQQPETIRRILHTARTIAIVGLSANPLRPSHFVGFYLQRHGYRIVPVTPMEQEVLGEKAYPSLLEVPFPVDVVDVFRRPEAVPEIAGQAIAIRAKAMWLQYGVINFEAAEKAANARLDVIMDRCMKVEHARYLGRMHWLGLNTEQVTARRGKE